MEQAGTGAGITGRCGSQDQRKIPGSLQKTHRKRARRLKTGTSRLRQIVRRFKHELAVYRLVMRHPETPWLAKSVLWLAIGYLMMPFDLIPDFIPVLGQLDELVILPGLVYLALRLTPDAIVAECRAAVKDIDNSENGKPNND